MARPPDADGVPTIMPDTRVPDDYQHIQANPSAFGAQTAQGLERLGQGIEKVGDDAWKINRIYEQNAVTEQVNQVRSRADLIRWGDPNTIGADGKPQPGFLSLQGRAAMDAYPSAEKELNDSIDEARRNLKSPWAKQSFETAIRRVQGIWRDELGRHASTQSKTWGKEVNSAEAGHWTNFLAMNANDPEAVITGTNGVVDAFVKNAELHGAQKGDPVWMQAVREGRQKALEARLDAVAAQDPSTALDTLDKFKDVAGTQYDNLVSRYRPRALQQRAIALGQRAVSGVIADPDQVHGAIIQQESGGNPNAKTSVTGATGIGQIQPETFKQYARPGESIKNPADNLAVSKRIVADLYQRFNGDPVRVAVAYFSGPGNVAPLGSPTPWLKDKTDPTGKSVSSYVADITGRLGGIDPSAGFDRATAYKRARELSGGDPLLQSGAITYINRAYEAADGARRLEQQNVSDLIKSDLASMASAGKGVQLGADRVSNALGPVAAKEWQESRDDALAQFSAAHDLYALPPTELEQRVSSLAPQPGDPNFVRQEKIYTAVRKRADALISLRASDPAASVQPDPAVQSAAAAVHPNDPVSYQNLMAARLAAQTRAGIPEGSRSPITRAEADELTTPLDRIIPGQERAALKSLGETAAKKYGPYADQALAYALSTRRMSEDTGRIAARVLRALGPGQSPSREDLTALEGHQELDAAKRTMEQPAAPGLSFRRANPVAPSPENVTSIAPSAAIKALRGNPDLAVQFDKKYGAGSARKILQGYPLR